MAGVVVLAGCGDHGAQQATRDLNNRLQARLAPDVAAGDAAIQPLPDGARVTLLAPGPTGTRVWSANGLGLDTRAHVVNALLDPTLMRIAVTDSGDLPDEARAARVRDMQTYLSDYGLAPTLQPGAVTTAAGPAGLALTISVQCPPPPAHYAYLEMQPGCE
jgi:hypothetical protein